MRILQNDQIAVKLVKLINRHDEINIAVAWATQTKVVEELKQNKQKIRKCVVGTHSHLTDSEFIEWSHKNSKRIRFKFDKTYAIFHPKIYLFITDKKFDLLIGSANMTVGGMVNNEELMIHISDKDRGGNNAKEEILDVIKDYWKDARAMSTIEISEYKEKKENLDKERYRKRIEEGVPDKRKSSSRPNLERRYIQMLSCDQDWRTYYREVRRMPKSVSFQSRLDYLRKAKDMFKVGGFLYFDAPSRYAIAGIESDENWGGESMVNAWGKSSWFTLKWVCRNKDKEYLEELRYISDGLDCIPKDNIVTRMDYLSAIEKFILVGKNRKARGWNLTSIGRLLMFKRPDVFCAFNNPNKKNLLRIVNSQVSDIKNDDYEGYWDDFVVPAMDSLWYNSEEPKGERERLVWTFRVALLDVFAYKFE